MIVSVSIDDILREGKTEIVGVYKDKRISPNVEVVCNEDNLLKALNMLLPIFKGKKTKIMHVSYEGGLSVLEEVLFSADYSAIPIVLKRDLSSIDHVDLMVASLPKNVRLVIKVDIEVPNLMKVIHAYSGKYPNISFCGYNLIAFKGCRLGCTDKVIKDLTSEDGCYMGYDKISIDDISDLEFVSESENSVVKVKEKVVREPKTKKEKVVKKPKKAVSSILAKRLNKGV